MRITKDQAQKFLEPVAGEGRFFCQDGKIFSNLEDLAKGLAAMSAETFRYHAGSDHCHFSDWTRDVFGNQALADALWQARARRPGKAAQVAADHLLELKAAAGVPPSRRNKNWLAFFS